MNVGQAKAASNKFERNSPSVQIQLVDAGLSATHNPLIPFPTFPDRRPSPPDVSDRPVSCFGWRDGRFYELFHVKQSY